MQKRLVIIAIVLLLLHSCRGQAKKEPEVYENVSGKRIIVSFAVNDSSIVIDNHFAVLFINGEDSLRPPVMGNQLKLEYFKKDSAYTVVFNYKNYRLMFEGITKQMIFPKQDVEWKFGVDTRPFGNNYKGLLSDAEYKNHGPIRELQYLQFNLLEDGDGIQFVNKIE